MICVHGYDGKYRRFSICTVKPKEVFHDRQIIALLEICVVVLNGDVQF